MIVNISLSTFHNRYKNKLAALSIGKFKSIARSTVIVCSGALFLITKNLYADSTLANHLLKLSPKQCVAVHQGQDCYVDIKIVWQTEAVGNYCLYSSQQNKPLKCWHQVTNILFEKELISNKNVTFSLKNKSDIQVLAKGELDMAWVYKKNVRSHASWRMF